MKKQEPSLKMLDNFKEGMMVKGKVLEKKESKLFIDLGFLGIGLIYGKEFKSVKKQLKSIQAGDEIKAQVSNFKNQDGYIELSLKKIIKTELWKLLKEKQLNKENIKVKILEFNKGGLLTQVEGLSAFLPLSQLSSNHYPRIKNNDISQIVKKLQEFVGKIFTVTILDLNEQEEKIILSEKNRETEKIIKALQSWKENEIVEGRISGLADFGLFIKFPNKQVPQDAQDKDSLENIREIEGFIHKSEIDWKLVTKVHNIFRVGDKVKAKIVKIENEKIFLSLKALKRNPWKEIQDKYQKNDYITGSVVKFTPYGAFIIVKEGVQGLIHLSNFDYSRDKMEENLTINKEYKFQVINIDIEKHRLILKFNKNTKIEKK